MRTFNLSASDANRRYNDFLRRKLIYRKAYRGNIRNRIHRSDLVKMYITYRHCVNSAFGLCNKIKYRKHIFFYFFRQLEMVVYDMLNVRYTMMLMCMVMLMVVMMFMLMMIVVFRRFVFSLASAVYRHTHMRSRNSAFNSLFIFKCDLRYPYRIQLAYKCVRIRHKLRKRCCQHISCRTHGTIQI